MRAAVLAGYTECICIHVSMGVCREEVQVLEYQFEYSKTGFKAPHSLQHAKATLLGLCASVYKMYNDPSVATPPAAVLHTGRCAGPLCTTPWPFCFGFALDLLLRDLDEKKNIYMILRKVSIEWVGEKAVYLLYTSLLTIPS